MEKLAALFGVLQSGSEIVAKEKAKAGSITINNIILVLSALIGLINTFGYNIDLTNEQLIGISSACLSVYALFNNVSHAATSKSASINPIENVKILIAAKQNVKELEPSLINEIKENQE